jgi:molecular chaperone GrpE
VNARENAEALERLIRGLDFESEQYFDVYANPAEATNAPAAVDSEVWSNVSGLNADLNRLRGEVVKLRSGVESLRLPAVELVGLDRLAENLRSLEARLKPLAPAQQQKTPEEDSRLQRVLKELLTVADTLERVLELMDSQPGSVSTSVATGLRSVYDLLIGNLGRAGVKQAPVSGVFDPHVHLAVGTEENPDVPDGHISRVLQRGYLYNEFVLRTGQVVVTKNMPA